MLVESFAEIGGSQAFSYGLVESKDSEAFGEIGLHPCGKFRSRVRVFFHSKLESGLGGGKIFCVEDGANIRSDGFFHALFWHVSLGVLLEVKLAAVPRHTVIDGGNGGFETLVGITGDGRAGVQAAGFKRGKELAPVDFCLGEGDRDAQDGSMTVLQSNPDGCEHGAGAHDAIDANFFIACIKDEVSYGLDGTLSPRLQHVVEFRGGSTDLRGCNFQATKFF